MENREKKGIITVLQVFVLVSAMPVFLFSPVVASASESKAVDKASARKPVIKSITPGFREEFQKYCFNNSDAAHDAKVARQIKQIRTLEKRLKETADLLARRKKEIEKWVIRREKFVGKMTTSLVKIYSIMEPEAAAAQIAVVDYDIAISILTRLKPREASAILNEMKPERAGRLVNVIIGSTKSDVEKEIN